MPANTAPLYSLTPNVGRVNITSFTVKSDGTGTIATDIFKAFTAGANGSWVSKARFNPVATAAATALTATVGRIFLSTITSGATVGGTDTFLVGEVTLGGQTAAHATAATASLEFPLNFALNASQTLLASIHTTLAASTFWQVTIFGGDY